MTGDAKVMSVQHWFQWTHIISPYNPQISWTTQIKLHTVYKEHNIT